MSVQRFELYQFSAVDVFLELLKRRICYYTKKVQQNDTCPMAANEKFSLRLIRSKLRKREESSGMHRTNVVHPEGVFQATTIVGTETTPEPVGKVSPLEDIVIAASPASNRTSFTTSEISVSAYSLDISQLPVFLYTTGNSKNSLNSTNDQDVLVHPSGPAEDIENNNNINNNNNNHHHNKEETTKKNIKGKLRKLVRRKSPPAENYSLPEDLREQLKTIYVY